MSAYMMGVDSLWRRYAQRALMPRIRGLPRLQATSSPGYAVLLISSAYAPSRCLDTSMISCALTASGHRLVWARLCANAVCCGWSGAMHV